ncbi:YheT family hydrolase [Bdellovibrio sp. HCB337]|uniref:YheT family hydrolase n=1 Tax=Bdellovibrio sp. HCB337 TaxID=3394358 RepID=UPI0039A61222
MSVKIFSGHVQTLLGHFIPSPKMEEGGEKHVVDLPDGDRLVGFLFRGASDYVISLYHGLSGDIDSDYMQRTAIQYRSMGHSVFLVNHRGVGEGVGMAQHPYHSGRAEDVSQVVHYLRKQLPDKKQITVGFSMSGNMVLYLLSRQKGEHLPDGAITVNAPINLSTCAVALTQGFNRCYDLRFVRRLREQKNLDISPWAKLTQVDDIYTAPKSGFRDRHHYYEVCSAKNHVHNIQTPVCVLTAEDDPFIPVQDYREAKWSTSVELKIHPYGGHMGYISVGKNRLGNRRWLDAYLVESLNSLIQRI